MDFREITERSKLKDDKLSVWREGQIFQIHCRFSRKWCTYSVSTNFRPELIDQPSAKDNIFKSCRERRARGEWGEMWTWRSNLSCFQTVILSYINHCRVVKTGRFLQFSQLSMCQSVAEKIYQTFNILQVLLH